MNSIKNFAVVVVCVLGMTGVAWGQTFTLKNGDTVSGELIAFDGDAYRIKSKYGVLSFESKEVESIVFNAKEGVVDIQAGEAANADRDRIRGVVESFQNGKLRIKTAYGYVVIEQPEKVHSIQ